MLELFPEIGLNKLRLMEQCTCYSFSISISKINLVITDVKLDIKALKKYFEEVAIKNTFDPLVPDDWINAHKSNVIQNIPKHVFHFFLFFFSFLSK